MIKQWICIAIAALVLSGCQTGSNSSEATTEAVTSADQESVDQVVTQRVEEIYGDVFKAYNKEDSLRNLDITMKPSAYELRDEFNTNYCSKQWTDLVNKIDQIDSTYHAGEVGFWEADYWIMGQDWHNLHISDVKVLKTTASEAQVEFKLHNLDFVKTVKVTMVNEDGVWKIDNFLDDEVDVKQAMSRYVKEETEKNAKK